MIRPLFICAVPWLSIRGIQHPFTTWQSYIGKFQTSLMDPNVFLKEEEFFVVRAFVIDIVVSIL